LNQRQELIIAVVLILTALASLLIVLTYYGPGSHQAVGVCGAGTEVNISSTKYCALNVTADSEILVEGGYTRLKQPISYMGVNFTTSCGNGEQCGNIGCPPTYTTCVMMSMGAIKLNMAFSDGTNETVNAVIGDTWPLKLSQHSNPRAGFEMLGPYNSPELFLLVQEPSEVLYNVTFQQDGVCSPEVWVGTWSVVVGNQTKVQPEDTPLPLDDYNWASTENQSLSAITFALPDGSYLYQVHPTSGLTPNSGVVNVAGGDVVIHISPIFFCTTTTAATP
jgi:hypothetical protein